MLDRVKKIFKNTRDVRNKFNIVIASFILVNISLLIIFFSYAKVFEVLFNSRFLMEMFFSIYIFLPTLIISYFYSKRVYHWHYQKENFVIDFSKENNLEGVPYVLRFELIAYVIYSIFPFFAFISLLITAFVTKGYFEQEEFIVTIFALIFFIYKIVARKLKCIDIDKFNELELYGYHTKLSKED